MHGERIWDTNGLAQDIKEQMLLGMLTGKTDGADNWQKLQRQIKKASKKYPAKIKEQNKYGTLYEQKIVLYGENDTPANVIVGWIKDEKTGSMRMTSTYIKEVK